MKQRCRKAAANRIASELLQNSGNAAEPLTCPELGPVYVGWTLPWTERDDFRRQLGPRVVVWSKAMASVKCVGLLSSRLGQRLDQRRDWFDILRTTAALCVRQRECLLSASGTAAAPFVERASQLFDAIHAQVVVAQSPQTIDANQLAAWILRTCQKIEKQAERLQIRISPLIRNTDQATAPQKKSAIPLNDAALLAASHRVVVSYCRAGGHIDRLIHEALRRHHRPPVILLAATRMQKPLSHLVDAGGIPWLLESCSQSSCSESLAPVDATTALAKIQQPKSLLRQKELSSKCDNPVSQPSAWLCHWTRARCGPWPDQTDEEFLDELILGCEGADRSVLSALLRIIREKKLRASTGIGNGRKAVSWTAVPLSAFRTNRVFRPHKRQYDFEPWGIAVRRTTLQQRGTHKVSYISAHDAHEAPFLDRDFVHPASWSHEREWRTIGDVDLGAIPPNDICVFADTQEWADFLNQVSPWPVVVVP